jgi:NAD(P)-dependent dehydrogenase (short-subunit alcohol dehydrogenase family)
MKVIITGGSRGIGLSIKTLFEKMGHNVYSPTRNELDLSKDFKLNDNTFDIIINNAGINPLNNIMDMDQEIVMQTNYYAPLKILKDCIPYMINQNYGRIVNIGSIWSHISKEKRAAYSASKSALESLSRSITSEYGKYNILANTVSPGFIFTDLTINNNSVDQIEELKSSIPLNKLGNTEDVAKLVYHLTIENNYIAGQNIIIDGGYSCVA